ncbi:MAG: DUF255 domain-containing protein [Myxococcales bacterium]|nr:DUF255 domain-containing protein [Myxococcales bacterium]
MRLRSLLLLSLLAGCGGPPQSAARPVPSTPPGAASPPAAPVAWNDFTPALFARAKAEGRFVVLDGAAEWCHFCHVMDEKTYGDARARGASEALPRVKGRRRHASRHRGALHRLGLARDGHLFARRTRAREVPGVHSAGRIPRDLGQSRERRRARRSARGRGRLHSQSAALRRCPRACSKLHRDGARRVLGQQGRWLGAGTQGSARMEHALRALRRAARRCAREGARAHDPRQADEAHRPGLGRHLPIFRGARLGSPTLRKAHVLERGALAAYAEAFALTNDPKQRARAADIRRYFEGFLLSEGGAFYGTQDADLNSHASSVPFAPTSPRGKGEFMKGEDYYKLPDAARRVLGVPRIDPNIYADDNGLAIYALATLARATNDSSASALAKRAADHILREHITAEGGVLHLAKAKGGGDQSDAAVRVHLSDAAALGFGLAHLADVLTDGALQREAGRIATFLEKNLYDEVGGGFFAQPVDPNAVGIFRSRRKPFDDNVLAARFLLRLDMLEGAAKRRGTIEHTVRSLSSAAAIKDRGKFLGDYLLLLDELTSHRRLPASVPSPAATEPSGHPPAPKAPPKAAPKRPAPARDPARL